MAKIADAFSMIRNGANIKQGLDNSGYPITRIETISNRTVDRNKMGYAGVVDISKYADYVLQDGDILMSHINSETHLGKVALYEKYEDETIIHGMNLLCLRPKQELLDSRFAFYYLSSEDFLRQIPRITKKSVNQASFNVAALKELTIPIPEIEKQRDIARGLDKVSKLISLRKEQLTKLDQLVKSRFVELFEGKYKTVKLGDVVKTTSGGTPSKAYPEYYENGTIPWLTSGEVNAGVITSVKNYITDLGMKNSSAKIVPANSVVIAMYGATAGVTGLIRLDTTTNQAVCSILPSERFIPEYLYYAVASKKDWMLSQCQGGGQPNISQGIIKNMDVIDAPIKEQMRFAAFVEQTNKTKLTIQASLDKLEVMKKALMQEYFG